MTHHAEGNPMCLNDGAYLLGALPPHERAAYEAHLARCRACAESMAQLSGLPGLLRTVPPEVLAAMEDTAEPAEPAELSAHDPVGGDPVTDARERAGRERRRRRWLVAAPAAVAASVLLVVAVLAGLPGQDARVEPPAPDGQVVALTGVGGAGPLSVTAALESVAWGTRIEVRCRYDAVADSPYPGSPSYSLLLTRNDGQVEQVASWQALPGRDMVLQAATALRAGEIARIEVRTASGEVALQGEA